MKFEFSEDLNPEIWYPVKNGSFSARDINRMLNGYFVRKGKFRFRLY